ncbi:MAG: ABC transporter ATP-binding protein [Desulfomonilaceae bacterium]|nr:ABC transporter ATP-binding protein [Desulfomonilaceae bacterium]
MTERLSAHGLTLRFGRIRAVDDFSFSVKRGEILGIIGPNGAGKSTAFDLLSGSRKPDKGRVLFDGMDITHESPQRRCRLGIGRTHQVPRPFENMTVYENALVAAVNGGERSGRNARNDIHDLLDRFGLLSKKDVFARELSLVERKLLEIARCLATGPTLMLLDEPVAGVGGEDQDRIVRIVADVRDKGVTIVWIEHIITVMTEAVDRLLVMAQGRELIGGPPERVMNTREVLEAYLGPEGEQ